MEKEKLDDLEIAIGANMNSERAVVFADIRKELEDVKKTPDNKPSMLCNYYGEGCDCSYQHCDIGIEKCDDRACRFIITQAHVS